MAWPGVWVNDSGSPGEKNEINVHFFWRIVWYSITNCIALCKLRFQLLQKADIKKVKLVSPNYYSLVKGNKSQNFVTYCLSVFIFHTLWLFTPCSLFTFFINPMQGLIKVWYKNISPVFTSVSRYFAGCTLFTFRPYSDTRLFNNLHQNEPYSVFIENCHTVSLSG